MRTDLPIHHYNPELPLCWLKENCPVSDTYTRLLRIDRSVVRKPDADYVIPVSLFNRNLHDYTGLTKSDYVCWRTKYYGPLLLNISNLSNLGRDVCVDIFVDPELSDMAVSEIKDERVNLHVMSEPSLGATGMFWRFMLADLLGKRKCQNVVQMDIDLDWSTFFGMLSRYLPVAPTLNRRGEDSLTVCKKTKSKKYTSICGGLFSYRLSDVDFNVSEIISRYWYYCNVLLATVEPKTDYNRSHVGGNNGFGNTWNLYGSDERFLCKVLYYTLKRKGALNFLMKEKDRLNLLPAELADINFTQKHGSKIIYV